jgi:ABC-type multidrug transport system fused ATPase/permease subunit
MRELYRAVWRVSGREQILLVAIALLVAALASVPLHFQQLAINGLVENPEPRALAWSCAGFVGAILLSAALKFVLGLRLSLVGERVVRLIRERLYTNLVDEVARDPAAASQRGRILAMLNAEAELVGSFAGAAVASPLLQTGTLVSVIAFIVASQPLLGAVAFAVIVPQAAIVVTLQQRINQRVRSRVQSLRDVSDRISGGGLARIDNAVLTDFQDVFETRRAIFGLKLSSKFALGALSALGKVGILFLGGWFVLQGATDVGTVVASLTGLTRIEGPWRDLVTFYRTANTVRVKYAMLLPAIAARA